MIVETGKHTGTTISVNGLLTISADEALNALTVRAASTANTAKSGTAAVMLANAPPVVTGVTITPPSGPIAKGDSNKQFTAIVFGSNSPPQTVTWTIVTGGKHSGTKIEADGKLTVDKNEKLHLLTVKAVSTFDNAKSTTANVTLNPYAGAKWLEMTDFPGAVFSGYTLADFEELLIYPKGTADFMDMSKVTAAGGSDTTQSGGTVRANLRLPNEQNTGWTDSGEFEVIIVVRSYLDMVCYKKKSSVKITTETTTFSTNDFEHVLTISGPSQETVAAQRGVWKKGGITLTIKEGEIIISGIVSGGVQNNGTFSVELHPNGNGNATDVNYKYDNDQSFIVRITGSNLEVLSSNGHNELWGMYTRQN